MKHIEQYNSNIAELNRLLKIHSTLIAKPGFRRSLEILNKSQVVFLVACWEAFVEELAANAFTFMLSHATSHNAFPAKVLTQASKTFWDSKDERGVWALAGDGWKNILISHKDKILNEYLYSFHTPRPAQVDKLFESLVGVSSLSSNWHWRSMNANQAKRKLKELIDLRGSIAHKVSASKAVTKKYCLDSGFLITRLGVTSSNTLRKFIHNRVGEYPWIEIRLKHSVGI